MEPWQEPSAPAPRYLVCEHKTIYRLLMLSAGMMGAYTYNVRGGVFCNAQTANVMMMAVALGKGQLAQGFYYLIPISAYCLGAFVSEALPSPIKRLHLLRWDTCLVAFEMAVLLAVGFVPLAWPNQLVQVAVNFIASMQYNTFRQAEGVPMATTFCTNHIRQIGIALARVARKHDTAAAARGWVHGQMVLCFLGGSLALTALCSLCAQQAIWLALAPLGAVLFQLVRADLQSEHDLLDRKPAGH